MPPYSGPFDINPDEVGVSSPQGKPNSAATAGAEAGIAGYNTYLSCNKKKAKPGKGAVSATGQVSSGGPNNDDDDENSHGQKKEHTPDSHPDEFTKQKNGQGYKEKKTGHTWKKDMLHKDHWDVSDSRGHKVKEVDFNGRQIWPDGPKNKNKR